MLLHTFRKSCKTKTLWIQFKFHAYCRSTRLRFSATGYQPRHTPSLPVAQRKLNPLLEENTPPGTAISGVKRLNWKAVSVSSNPGTPPTFQTAPNLHDSKFCWNPTRRVAKSPSTTAIFLTVKAKNMKKAGTTITSAP